MWALARMDAAEDVPLTSREALVREIAVAERDLDAIKDTYIFWQAACIQKLLIGDALWRAGSAERARPFLEEVLAASCQRHTVQRAALAAARVDLAEIALEDGRDPAEHITAARKLWPSPDADHPLAVRLAALEAR